MQIGIIAGVIGKDAETRRTQSGDAVTGFSVAVSEGRDKPTTWWDCSIWGKRGESLAQYIRKGGRVTVSGPISTREYEGKTYLQCRVDQITLQSKASEPSGETASVGGLQNAPERNDLDDEIPF